MWPRKAQESATRSRDSVEASEAKTVNDGAEECHIFFFLLAYRCGLGQRYPLHRHCTPELGLRVQTAEFKVVWVCHKMTTFVMIYSFPWSTDAGTALLTAATEGPSLGYPSPALPRSWSQFLGNCRQKLTNLLQIDFEIPPRRALRGGSHNTQSTATRTEATALLHPSPASDLPQTRSRYGLSSSSSLLLSA